MVVRFGPVRRPFFSGASGVLVGAADGGVHAVHGLYYLLMHGLFGLFGTDLLVLRSHLIW
ncbi:hypothetical protein AB1339_34620 [Streptomyces cyaneofuscatus]